MQAGNSIRRLEHGVGDQILGIGAGQMSRVDAAKIAVAKAREFDHDLEGSVAASDAFFPFPDGVETCLVAGVSAVVEPGGSRKDDDVIAAVDVEDAATALGIESIDYAGEDKVGRPTRSMVTTNAPGSSGGINLADISRDVGGGGPGMGGVAVSRVASSIGSGGDGFSDRPLAGGAMAGRTDEEIQIVFDRYKAALYRLYNRELRRDPTLRGQIIIKLTIEPDGTVSYCTMHSSDMNAPTLAEQVIERVSTFDFGAKEDIAAVTIIYPIDFLPAA